MDGVGWRDGEKRHTTVIEQQLKKKKKAFPGPAKIKIKKIKTFVNFQYQSSW